MKWGAAFFLKMDKCAIKDAEYAIPTVFCANIIHLYAINQDDCAIIEFD